VACFERAWASPRWLWLRTSLGGHKREGQQYVPVAVSWRGGLSERLDPAAPEKTAGQTGNTVAVKLEFAFDDIAQVVRDLQVGN
jgi:hypothetical protein